MANITIRDLPDAAKESLRIQAAQAGVSLEAYARHILQKVSVSEGFQSVNIADLAQRCFGEENGIDIVLPSRKSLRETVEFLS